MPYLQVMM